MTTSKLRYGSDSDAGIRRRGRKRFSYVNERTGRPPSRADLERIVALAIPPAWSDVWIAADPLSHLQATGRDARGRKQYRYHQSQIDASSADKFAELIPFASSLGRIRRQVTTDLRSKTLDHDQVVAAVVRLLDTTSLRVGNQEYERDNRSFGLTTLHQRHAKVRGSTIYLDFKGKSNHHFDVDIANKTLARIVRRCQHLPGQHLFQYEAADGARRTVSSTDVNAYLAEHGDTLSTAKTFRTWNATVQAADLFAELARDGAEPVPSVVNQVVDTVAQQLGNTRAVCRNSYIHPLVIDSYLNATLLNGWARPVGTKPGGLRAPERRTLRLLANKKRR
ncbi:MAG TPA: hypothetical protein VMM60_02480 [Ilumatobacter sp.]|nr:hypothetical protein [Ilumatobacter sp.]